MLSGENGILKQATNAKEITEQNEDIEKIKLAITEAQIGENGYQELNFHNFQKALNNQFGEDNAIVYINEDGTYDVDCLNSLKSYEVNENNVYQTIDWKEKMEKAVAPEGQADKSVIGIGTDGNVVNMDLWEYTFDSETGGLSISPYTTKGTKCYLYFDEQLCTGEACNTILANKTLATRTDFSTTLTTDTTGTIYYADTSKGRTYYFAGAPTDNWVRWAGFYWRIIRINEDGTIRMIYQGTSANTTGSNTQTQTSAFNSSYNNNAYVGLKYTTNSVHGTGTNSTILGVLNTWYTNNLSSYADDLDGNAGFCGDRTPYTNTSGTTSGGGTGTTTTYYGGYVRLYGNSSGVPTFECASDSDLYTTSGSSDGNRALTYPIGLISMDEAWYAGGYSSSNSSYYLYTEQAYWAMSPSHFINNGAYVFRVNSDGWLGGNRVDSAYGVRPVVNLKASVQFSSGDGTASNPFVVS